MAEYEDWARQATARTQAATVGPWTWENDQYIESGPDDQGHMFIDVVDITHDGGCGCRMACEIEVDVTGEDRDFITASRIDMDIAMRVVAQADPAVVAQAHAEVMAEIVSRQEARRAFDERIWENNAKFAAEREAVRWKGESQL